MGLRLSVRRQPWTHVLHVQARDIPGLVPVVKGNGYGFGRDVLAPIAATLSPNIAVGTVFETTEVPPTHTPYVLTPHVDLLPSNFAATSVLTVSSIDHVRALRAQHWQGRVTIKLRSDMNRYGVAPADLADLVAAIADATLVPVAYALHFALVGEMGERVAQLVTWLPLLDPNIPIALSHLDDATYLGVLAAHPERIFHLRRGTALWHHDKSLLQLSADVTDIHAVQAGDTCGYRNTVIAADGHAVLVAAGSSHGVRPLPDGRSPFHFARQRISLIESPHMHTSMLFIPADQARPEVGDRVDVQRPLIETLVDQVEWLDD